jgi:hypothetical protein
MVLPRKYMCEIIGYQQGPKSMIWITMFLLWNATIMPIEIQPWQEKSLRPIAQIDMMPPIQAFLHARGLS